MDWYEGNCPTTGQLLRLPRTAEAEAIARQLMAEFSPTAQDPKPQHNREGKMYGILIAETAGGDRQILKAFSGLLDGQAHIPGWVEPIAGRDRIALEEAQTLAQLEALKQQIIALKKIPERALFSQQSQLFEQRLQTLMGRHRDRKNQRQKRRAALIAIAEAGSPDPQRMEALDEESRREGMERRNLKRDRKAILTPLQTAIAQADDKIRTLKLRRKTLSRQLQAKMHQAYSITNFGGEVRSLAELMPDGLPTGTGDCCAPKLLQAAAQQALKPVAMAEFWWGPASEEQNDGRAPGQFYGPCAERCQPIMGFLLSGITSVRADAVAKTAPVGTLTLSILFEDDWLLAIDKPAGLLSVPGRTGDRQDSVLSRLRNLHPQGGSLLPLHRLDQATSGILLLAKDPQTHRQMSQQFAQRQVTKRYEAIVMGSVLIREGKIELPLWGNPQTRPRQSVDWEKGKPCLTEFRLLPLGVRLSQSQQDGQEENRAYTRLELIPRTGRTHQLRVHLSQGLGTVILGDRLYGSEIDCRAPCQRLHLHAKTLEWLHPRTGEWVILRSSVPF